MLKPKNKQTKNNNNNQKVELYTPFYHPIHQEFPYLNLRIKKLKYKHLHEVHVFSEMKLAHSWLMEVPRNMPIMGKRRKVRTSPSCTSSILIPPSLTEKQASLLRESFM